MTSYMEESEWIEKVGNGDPVAFAEWMDIYSCDIERFAFQYGCSPEQAGEVAEDTFREVVQQMKTYVNEDGVQLELYKIAIKKFSDFELISPIPSSILTFEEDEQLHHQIIQLTSEEKLALILSQFHGMNDEEVALIIGIPVDDARRRLTAAFDQLEGGNLEKRLGFLGKSYRRIRSSFRKEMVFQGPVESLIEVRIEKKSMTKKALFSWIAGVSLLIILLTISVVTSEEYKRSSDEKYLARLKTSFENEMATKYMTLGLVEPKGEEQEFYSDMFGYDERQQFEGVTKKIQEQLTNNEKINRKNVQEQYGEIMGNLELPSEMVAKLLKKPLSDDRASSEVFIKAYINKVNWISDLYRVALYEHKGVIIEKVENGTIDVEELLQKKNTYPEEIRTVLGTMGDQNIGLVKESEWDYFHPIYLENEVGLAIRDSIHEDFRGYLTFLGTNPFNYLAIQSGSTLQQTVDYIVELENTLLVDQQEDQLYQNVLGYYNNVFYDRFILNEDGRLTGSDGKLKKEYRLAWEKLANTGENSPSAYIMQQIVKEMEESDWETSDSLERLEYHHLYDAVGFAKRGDLQLFTLESVMQESDNEVAVNNPEYIQEVERTYVKFTKGHRLNALVGVKPVVILGVYLYANEQEDPKTMWHLTNRESLSLTLKEYVTTWRKQEYQIEKADILVEEIGSNVLNGVPLTPISYEYKADFVYDGWLILDEGTGAWLIETAPKVIVKQ